MTNQSKSIDIRFNAPQFRAFRAIADRRSLFLGWSRGTGKSHFVRNVLYTKVAEHDGKLRANCSKRVRGVRFVFFMPTLVQFKDVHWADLENDLLPGGDWDFLGAKFDRQRGQVNFPGGSWFKAFPSTMHNSKAGRGIRCDGIVADECDDTEPEAYDSVAIPWLSEPWSFGWEFITGTPTRGRYGLWYRSLLAGKLARQIRRGEISTAQAVKTDVVQRIRGIFEALPAKDWPKHLPRTPDEAALEIIKSQYAFHATYRDAPETVSPLAVAQARAKMSPATFKREWEADPDAGEGIVYPFDDDFHVREVPHGFEFSEYLVGVDHGFNPDPGVFLLAGVAGSGENAYVWILDEIYETERIGDWWVEQARTWSAATQPDSIWIRRALDRPASHLPFYCDPSGAERIAKLQQAGINALKANNAIEEGIDCVANLMVKRYSNDSDLPFARFYVRPNCVNMIRELGMYRRKPDPRVPGNYLTQPIDRNNHACDAMRYLCRARFGSAQGGRSERPR